MVTQKVNGGRDIQVGSAWLERFKAGLQCFPNR